MLEVIAGFMVLGALVAVGLVVFLILAIGFLLYYNG